MKKFKPLNLGFFEYLKRILRHSFTPSWRLKKLLSNAELETIAQCIKISEQQHTAEIAIAFETRLPWSYLRRHAHSRERAWSVFSKMQVWDTPDNNGVLLYFLMAERRIEIVADRSCAQIINKTQWETWVRVLYEAIQNNNLNNGIQQVVKELTSVLVQHFPQVEETQENRVSNQPQIL